MLNKALISLITIYQRVFSALMGPRCRFYPSCSHYTKEAIEIHGSFQGTFLGVKRILRCHPWHEGGYDPVPGHIEDAPEK